MFAIIGTCSLTIAFVTATPHDYKFINPDGKRLSVKCWWGTQQRAQLWKDYPWNADGYVNNNSSGLVCAMEILLNSQYDSFCSWTTNDGPSKKAWQGPYRFRHAGLSELAEFLVREQKNGRFHPKFQGGLDWRFVKIYAVGVLTYQRISIHAKCGLD